MESPIFSNASMSSMPDVQILSPSWLYPDHASSGALLGLVSGIIVHLTVFRVGEWDVAAPSIVATYFFTLTATAFISTARFQMPLSETFQATAYHFAGLIVSMLIYRGFFHRLSKYPGPFLARLTTLYITVRSVRKMHLFEEVRSLHAQYGDIVRLGPTELSIASPEAVRAIYGSHSPVTKGPWYTLLEPRTPLFMARDKQEHARRRKVWDRGFSTKALIGYEPRITKAINQLLSVIHQQGEKPLDISRWFNFLVFDVMEDLAFNKTSNMLRDGKESYVFETIRMDMLYLAFMAHMPWLLTLIKRTPILNNNYLKFWKWIQTQIDERKKNEPDQPDIFSWILAAFEKSPKTKRDFYNLHGDAQLIVIAGSDSVAASLTHIFLELAYDPVLLRRLRQDLDELPTLTHDNLKTVKHLDAVINETLRMHPPVPSGTQRVTPPEGLDIGGEHIPGNIIVQVPSYTVFRDPRAFVRPNEFIPERWTTQPELVLDKSVFIPFNTGPYGCVGKRLAMMEVRRVVADIVSRYDLTPAPGQSKQGFLDGKQDTFTTVSAPLPLIFTERPFDASRAADATA